MKYIRILITIVFVLVNLTLPAFGREITLYWEPSPSQDVYGYKVYYQQGTPQLPLNGTEADQGASPIDVENSLVATISGLEETAVYYFSVTAYDSNYNESTFSNIVSTAWMPPLRNPQKESIVVPWNVTFQWDPGPQEHYLNYTLYYGTDKNLVLNAGVVPYGMNKLPTASGPTFTNNLLALIFLLLVLTLFTTTSKINPRAVDFSRTAIAGIFVLALVACGGGGGGGDGSSSSASDADQSSGSLMSVNTYSSTSYQTDDLQSGTTYYWKVDAHSTTEPGTVYHSETYSFNTQ